MIRHGYFRRLLFSYLIILLIPVALLTTVNYLYITPRVYEQEREHSRRILEYVVREAELKVSEVFDAAYQFAADREFLDVTGDSRNDIVLLSRTIDRIDSIKHTYDGLHSVYLYLEDAGRLIASEYWYNSIDRFFDTEWIPAYRATPATMRIYPRRIPGSEQLRAVETEVVTLIYRLKNSRGALVFNISADVLGSSFRRLNRPNSTLFVIGADGREIGRYGAAPPSEIVDLISTEPSMETIGTDVVHDARRRLGVNRSPVVLTVIESGIADWSFIEATRLDYLRLTSRAVTLCIVVTAVIGVCMGFLLTWLYSRRLYSPIQALVSNVERDGYESSGLPLKQRFDEFAFITDAYESAVSEGETMRQALVDRNGLAREHYLQQLVKGEIADEESIPRRLESLGVAFHHARFCVANVEFDDWPRLTYLLNRRELKSHREQLARIAAESIHANVASLTTVYIEMRRVVLVINFEDAGTDGVRADMLLDPIHEIHRRVSAELGFNVSVGVGGVVSSVNEVYTSYYQSYRALEYKTVYGANQVLYIEDIKRHAPGGFIDMYTTSFSESDLEEAVVAGDVARISSTFKMAMQRLNEVGADFPYLRITFLRFVAMLSAIPYRFGAAVDGEDANQRTEELVRCTDVPEMERFVARLAERIVGFVRTRTDRDPAESLAEEALDYLDRRFSEPITLESTAESFGVSKHHLARVFKKHAGRTFVDYLTSKRLELARTLLEVPDTPIGAVARHVGYASDTSFRRAFKQRFNTTPSHYRRVRRIRTTEGVTIR